MAQIYVRTHYNADDFLAATKHQLQRREMESNLLLPFAVEKSVLGAGHPLEDPHQWWKDNGSPPAVTHVRDRQLETPDKSGSDVWITVWTLPSQSASEMAPGLDFALSCLDNQPVFLYSEQPTPQLTKGYVYSRISLLCAELESLHSRSRVFAVFGVAPVAEAFAALWSDMTSNSIISPPYYIARYTCVTPDTFITFEESLPDGHRMLLANSSYVEQVSLLCECFAHTSVHYPLTLPGAVEEARGLIDKGTVWIYAIDLPDGKSHVCTVVVLTRASAGVVAVSKVYTAEAYRCQGFARRLLRRACQHIFDQSKKAVLFVAHDNEQAARVYGSIGFVGVGGNPGHVDDWKEIGFEGAEKGHCRSNLHSLHVLPLNVKFKF